MFKISFLKIFFIIIFGIYINIQLLRSLKIMKNSKKRAFTLMSIILGKIKILDTSSCIFSKNWSQEEKMQEQLYIKSLKKSMR
jgi:hypothetical protein